MNTLQYTTDFKNTNMKPLRYMHDGDSGFDLQANITQDVTFTIHGRSRRLVPTGISVDLTPLASSFTTYELQIRSRSGLAHKEGIIVLNAAGTVDSNYTGEIYVNIYNTTDSNYIINAGDRIAQAVIAPVHIIIPKEVTSFDTITSRGANGHGSTGK